MKFHYRYEAYIIESELLLRTLGYLSSGKTGARMAKAAAFFPFVFVRNGECVTPVFINHERIHHRQQIETLLIGSWILGIFEALYSGLFLKLDAENRYLYKATEQEAYRNQEDLTYLSQRQMFSFTLYLKDKRKLSFVGDKSPAVLVGEKY